MTVCWLDGDQQGKWSIDGLLAATSHCTPQAEWSVWLSCYTDSLSEVVDFLSDRNVTHPLLVFLLSAIVGVPPVEADTH